MWRGGGVGPRWVVGLAGPWRWEAEPAATVGGALGSLPIPLCQATTGGAVGPPARARRWEARRRGTGVEGWSPASWEAVAGTVAGVWRLLGRLGSAGGRRWRRVEGVAVGRGRGGPW